MVFALNACHNSRILTGKHKALKPEQIIESYHHTDSFPSVASFRFNAEIISDGGAQSANCYIRMYQDSLIWISVRSMSLEGMRAVITPDSVKYIDRINNKYYRGDYSFVAQMSPLLLDFYDVQNLLLGKIMDSPKSDFDKLKPCNDSLFYCLKFEPNNEIRYDTIIRAFDKDYVNRKYLFYPESFFLAGQVFKSMISKETVAIYYGMRKNFDAAFFPEYIRLIISGYQESEIKLDTKNISFGSEFKTPFKIPDKYQAIRF
ncbi:MAG: DUF4292 domain-containing protein [Bacteroidales bacterium]|nr:DUF4292 domain-containing protein [Bacteroidales bacterium]